MQSVDFLKGGQYDSIKRIVDDALKQEQNEILVMIMQEILKFVCQKLQEKQ